MTVSSILPNGLTSALSAIAAKNSNAGSTTGTTGTNASTAAALTNPSRVNIFNRIVVGINKRRVFKIFFCMLIYCCPPCNNGVIEPGAVIIPTYAVFLLFFGVPDAPQNS